MSAVGRFFALLAAVGFGASGALAWLGDAAGYQVPLSSLLHPDQVRLEATAWYASMGVVVWGAGAVVIIGAVLGSRVLIVVGGLVGAGAAAAWILSNVLVHGHTNVTWSAIQVGAYLAVGSGLLALVVGATAQDTSRAHLA